MTAEESRGKFGMEVTGSEIWIKANVTHGGYSTDTYKYIE